MRRISNRKMENSRQNVQLVGGIWLFWLMVAAWRLALEKGMVPVRDVSSGEREARRSLLNVGFSGQGRRSHTAVPVAPGTTVRALPLAL